MKHNVFKSLQVFKLLPKVLDLCYDESVPQQMKKICWANYTQAFYYHTASDFGACKVGIAVTSAGKLIPLHHVCICLVNLLKTRPSHNGADMFDPIMLYVETL